MVLALLFAAFSVALALEPASTPAERIAAAEVVVVAEVVGQETEWNALEIGGMETTAWLSVEAPLKGAVAPGAVLQLALPGGRIGEVKVEVSGVPRLHTDRRYLLLLVARDDGRYALLGEHAATRLDTPGLAPGPELDEVLSTWGVSP